MLCYAIIFHMQRQAVIYTSIFYYFLILRRMGKNKAQAPHTFTYQMHVVCQLCYSPRRKQTQGRHCCDHRVSKRHDLSHRHMIQPEIWPVEIIKIILGVPDTYHGIYVPGTWYSEQQAVLIAHGIIRKTITRRSNIVTTMIWWWDEEDDDYADDDDDENDDADDGDGDYADTAATVVPLLVFWYNTILSRIGSAYHSKQRMRRIRGAMRVLDGWINDQGVGDLFEWSNRCRSHARPMPWQRMLLLILLSVLMVHARGHRCLYSWSMLARHPRWHSPTSYCFYS